MLNESDAYYQALSEAGFEAIFISEAGICLNQNSIAEKMFGYTLSEAIGLYALNWIAPESHSLVKSRIMSDNEEAYAAMAQCKNGNKFSVEIRGKMIQFQNHHVRVTALLDISDRKKAEAQVNKLYFAVEQSPVAVSITDTKGIIEYVNSAFEKNSGYTAK